MYKSSFIILLFFISINVSAQSDYSRRQTIQNNKKIVKTFKESLSKLYTKHTDSIVSASDSTELNPYSWFIFKPTTYMASATQKAMNIDWEDHDENNGLIPEEIINTDQLTQFASLALARMYVSKPSVFYHYDKQFDYETLVETQVSDAVNNKELTNIINSAEEIKDVADVTGDVVVDLIVEKPNFWTTKGTSSLQFSQNYISENWYKGGNNTQSLLTSITVEANYNDQKRLQWDNKLELKLGFVTAPSDTCHTYLTNNDRIYLLSKLGVKAAKSWYYTVSTEANTQFMPSYRTNNRKKFGMFLSPLDVYASIGMDYKPKLNNGNSLSVALQPLSFKMRYISTDNENIHVFYTMVGKHYNDDFGSKFELNSQITLAKNFTWKTRLFAFTSYKYTEAEFENTFNFQFSRYISAQCYTIWRFDDNRLRDYYDRNLGYFQFKEFLTFGLAYSF